MLLLEYPVKPACMQQALFLTAYGQRRRALLEIYSLFMHAIGKNVHKPKECSISAWGQDTELPLTCSKWPSAAIRDELGIVSVPSI